MTHEIKELKDGYGVTFIEGGKAVGLFSETELSEKEIISMYPKALNKILGIQKK